MSLHENPACTADLIVEHEGGIVLVKRKNELFKDYWALPGGFLETGKESLEEAAVRELKEETGLTADVNDLEFICVRSIPNRDPRSHVISHAYYVKKYSGQLKAGDDATDCSIVHLNTALTLNLAFDHKKILECYAEQFQAREKLAELEHEQWAHWTEYMLANMNEENINKWRRQAGTPYDQLSEKEKDSDRNWADKALRLLDELRKKSVRD